MAERARARGVDASRANGRRILLASTALVAAQLIALPAAGQTITVDAGETRSSNGATVGVFLNQPGALLTNNGTITSATATEAVAISSGATTATITNNSGGRITSTGVNGSAITQQSAATTLTLNNLSGAVISSTMGKAGRFSGPVTIDNSGTISSSQGIDLLGSTATITNRAGGVISASNAMNSAIYGTGLAGGLTVTNSGSITSVGRYGIEVASGSGASNITNNGTITGGTLGIYLSELNNVADTVTLNGASTTNGVFLGGGDDTLNIVAGAAVTGDLDGAAGTDTLNLSGASGTTTIGAAIRNFESIVKTGASSFTLNNLTTATTSVRVDAGALTLGNLGASSGALTVNGGMLTLAGGNAANWTGATTIATGATLVYDLSGTSTSAASITGAGNFTKQGTGTLTLGTGAGWTGVTTVAAGTLAGTTATIVGSSIVNNATLSYAQTASGTVAKAIGGTGQVTVSGLSSGNAVTFGGAVTAARGIRGNTDGHIGIGATGSVTTGGANSAIFLSGTGSSLNNAGTLTTASNVATSTVLVGVAGTVTNSGTILLQGDGGGRAVQGNAALTVSNAVGGLIENQDTLVDDNDPSGVFATGILSLTNAGTIKATGNAVVLYRTPVNPSDNDGSAGRVENSGTIEGGKAGIYALYAPTIVNTGTIKGFLYGVQMNLNDGVVGTVKNGEAVGSSALIDYTDIGIGVSSYYAGEVENYGKIRGFNFAIEFLGGGKVTNRESATIESVGAVGVYSQYGATEVVNAGTISGESGGLFLIDGGSLDNSGTITSAMGDGVRLGIGLSSFANSGTIFGKEVGVKVNGGNDAATTYFNRADGEIKSENIGILLNRGVGDLYLANEAGAKITGGTKGAQFYGYTELTNGGEIGSSEGIDFFDVGGKLVNSGTITSSNVNNSGIYGYGVASGLDIVNTGTIQSANIAIQTTLGTTGSTIVNSGTLTGGRGLAISLDNGADTVTLNAGSMVTGSIDLNGGDDTLTIDTGSAASPANIAITGTLDGGAAGTDTLLFTGTAGTIAVTGNIGNFESFTKAGANTLRLIGGSLGSTTIAANRGTIAFLNTTGSNRINVAGATLKAESAGAFGTGDIHTTDAVLRFAATGSYANRVFLDVATADLLAKATLLTADSGVTATLTGQITRSAGATAQPLTIAGGGTIVLGNTGNSWSGTTTIRAGATLQGTSQTISGGSIANSGALVFNQTGDGTFAIPISGAGTLTKTGGANLTLTGAGSWTGRTTVSAGTLTGTTASLAGAAGSPITVNATLAYAQSANGAASNAIDGTGKVIVSGLSAGNAVTFAGAVTNAQGIEGGTNGRIAITGSVGTTGQNAIVLSGAGAALTNGGTIGSTTTAAVRIASTNALVTNTAGHAITSTGDFGVFATGSGATLDNAGAVSGGIAGSGAEFYAGGTVTNQATGTITGGIAIGGFGSFTITSLGTLTALAAAPYNAAISIQSGTDSVTLGAGSTTTGFVELWDGDDALTLTGGSGAASATAVNGYINGGDGTDALVFNGTGGGTLTGNIGLFESIAKNGAGTWTIRNATDISATVNVNAGTLVLDGTSGLTNQYTLNSGILRAATAGAFGTGTIRTIDPTIQFGASGTYANAISLEVVAPAGSDPTILAADSGVTATLTGAITRGGGDSVQPLTIGGAGTIVLTNTGNSWNGTTTIDAGATLQGSARTLSGSGIVANGTLAFAQNTDRSFAVPISGSGNVIKTGGGNLTLAGAGTWTGTTIISAGTLTGTTASIGGTSIVTDAALVFAQGGNGTTAQAISGTGSVTKSGAGNLTLGGAGSWSGVTTITAGTLTGTSATIGGGAIINNAALVYDQAGNGTVTQAISGSGSLTKSGAGTLTLAGANSYAGATAVTAGTLRLGAGNRLSDTAALTVTGGTFDLQGFSDTVASVTSAGTLAGTGTLTAAGYTLNGGTVNLNLGAGTLTQASGSSTLNGTAAATTVDVTGGTLALGAANRLADSAAVTVAGTLDLRNFNDTVGTLALSGTLAGTGTLTATSYTLNGATVNGRLGTGTLIQAGGTSLLTGFTQAQVVDVRGGTLRLGASDVLSDTATLTVRGGATLDLQNFSDTVGSFSIMGTLTGTGMLTAGEYHLNGGTFDVALGAGRMFVDSGVNLLNATSGATTVAIGAATLRLGAGDRLSNNADVSVASGGVLDLQTFSDTVRSLTLAGRLDGSGTLTAEAYTLTGGTVNAGLGTGTLTQATGVSLLNATSAAGLVQVDAGTLRLGAAERLANGATLTVGGTLDLQGFAETVGSATLSGTLAGTGTLTAASYALAGANVAANLGTGTLNQLSGTSTLTGAAAAGTVMVRGGTLALGASNRLADGAAVTIDGGATLDLGAHSDTVASLVAAGTLAGTGTLTAATYALTGATIGGNLGAGTLSQLSGNSVLNGTSAAAIVAIGGGTLTLGASNRLADTAAVSLAAGAILDLGSHVDTVATFAAAGRIEGTGTLTAASYRLDGATVNANLGAGALTQVGGVSVLSGAAAAATVDIAGGTLRLGGNDRLADTAALTVTGTLDLQGFTDVVGSAAIAGTLAGTGTLVAASYTLNGGTVNANLGGGVLTQQAGNSVLNGASAAGTVTVAGGTLTLGAGDRLVDGAALGIAAGATLDLGAFAETVGTASIVGTLAGTGLLTAVSYNLMGGVVNARLGGGSLVQSTGVSTLNGTSAATAVAVAGGTLALGAADRLADTAALRIDAGATLDLGTHSDTVGTAAIAGVLAGSGTLRAGGYTLTGATVNANLGTGLLAHAGGSSVLNGTHAGDIVAIAGGTLSLGAADRLADGATVTVAQGAALNLGVHAETVGALALSGTLAGTGTLTAGAYVLNGGIVNANLGAGVLSQVAGSSLLAGTTAAAAVEIAGGTLTLGASDRLADAAAVVVAGGAALDLGGFSDTVATAVLAGTLGGTGVLTAAQYRLDGGTVNANLGTGRLVQATGASVLNGGAAATSVDVAGGTLTLGRSDRLADSAAFVVAAGATLDLADHADTVGLLALSGTLAGTGTLTAAQYQLTGATVLADLGAGTLFQLSGNSVLTGAAAADAVTVAGGTLTLGRANRLADTAGVTVVAGATLDLGTYDDGIGAIALAGTLAGTGTLTAGRYQLTGAAVNANLGTGAVFQLGSTTVLTGSSAAADVLINGGILRLGASDRLADTADVTVARGAVLDLADHADTIGVARIAGTLAGTGTLTAGQYQLTGATVNANLGMGTLFQLGGTSMLNGVSAARAVAIAAGTLSTGTSERIADAASVAIANGATLDLTNRTETIGGLFNGATGGGVVALGATGRLIVGGTNADFGYGGNVTGAGDVDKVGTGTFTFAPAGATSTARLNALGGTVLFAGQTAGAVRIAGGTLAGAGVIGGALSLSSGTLSPGTAAQPIGGFQAASLTMSGGTVIFDLAGSAGSNAADLIRVTGAATLTGGTVTTRLTEANGNYQVAQFYTVLQAGSIAGTFANGQTLAAVSGDATLQWRLRYDLVPNSVLVELRKQIDFATALATDASDNQRGVAAALNGNAFLASDAYAAALNQIASGDAAQRAATYESISGEAVASVASAGLTAAAGFADFMRTRLQPGIQTAGAAGTAGMRVDAVALARPGALDKLRASAAAGSSTLAGSDDRSLSAWLSGYGSDGRLDGQRGAADVETFNAGTGIGVDARVGAFGFGVGAGVNRIETRAPARSSRSEGTLWQLGGYAAYDDGSTYASVAGSTFEGDIASWRSVLVNGTLFGVATGETRTRGHTLGGTLGHRIALPGRYGLTPEATVGVTSVKRAAFTETGAGVLNLAVAAERRDLYQATGSLRLARTIATRGGSVEPYVSGGVRRSWGDRDAVSANRLTGAPVGAGSFTIEGAMMPEWTGLVGVGMNAGVSDRVQMAIGADQTFGDRLREGRISMNVRIGF